MLQEKGNRRAYSFTYGNCLHYYIREASATKAGLFLLPLLSNTFIPPNIYLGCTQVSSNNLMAEISSMDP